MKMAAPLETARPEGSTMRYYAHAHRKPPLSLDNIQDDQIRAALAHTRSVTEHARVEVKTLSAVCPIGRRGLAMTREAGVTPADFAQPDTAAIYFAIEAAELGNIIGDRERTYLLARRALILENLWDETDTRTFISGMVRGPGPLACLFAGLSRQAAERLAPELARQLVSLRERRAAA
jgi:hypothetical protein